jgi:hypothetical protein
MAERRRDNYAKSLLNPILDAAEVTGARLRE